MIDYHSTRYARTRHDELRAQAARERLSRAVRRSVPRRRAHLGKRILAGWAPQAAPRPATCCA